ncbi:MAG: hypothetical protein U0470_04135 [Anaerolineae bacterium]
MNVETRGVAEGPSPAFVRRGVRVLALLGAEAAFGLAAWAGVLVNPNLVPVSVQAVMPLALPLVVLGLAWRRIGPRMRGGIVPLLWFVVPIALCSMATVFVLTMGISVRAMPNLRVDGSTVRVVEFSSYSADMLGEHGGPCYSYRASILGGLASQHLGIDDCQFGAGRASTLRGSLKAIPGNAPGTFFLSYQSYSREFGETRRGPFRIGPGGWLVRVEDWIGPSPVR